MLAFLVLLSISLTFAANTADLVVLKDAVGGAACLDGTPPAFYIQKGSGTGLNKWQIHHEGGGWCTSIADCYARSQTVLGSSKTYPATMELPFGYLSNDATQNPVMYNWNKVYLKYCDGTSFSGNNNTITNYNGHNLFFRGFRNLDAYLTSLTTNYGLSQVTNLVISGCSAGGLATYLHVDWWRSKFPLTKVVGVPDSGFFLDYDAPSGKPHYATDMRWVFTQSNATSGVNSRCIAAHIPTQDTYKCFFAEHTAPYITTPIFPLQSEYDSWQAPNILGSNDPAAINTFGNLLTSRFRTAVLVGNTKNGAFLDSCYHHCNGWALHITGKNGPDVFDTWYSSGSGVAIQGQTYPCTDCCK